jgi:error-prone DNA polymerase
VEAVLHETHGLMVYQEDVTRTAMKLAGFNAFEGNQLRKIISGKAPEKLAVIKNKFMSGCYDYGLNEQQTKDLWAMIESFSGYSFCKPHSASYALVSFKAAYLKQRFPEYFLAAVLSNYGGFYATSAYLNYARRLGIRIKLPDINTSQRPFSASHKQITIGFEQIKGLHTNSVTQIIEERKNSVFMNLKDFMDRVILPVKDLKKLILVGAFDEIESGQTRSTLMLRALCHSPSREDNVLNAFHAGLEGFPQLPAFNEKQRDALETEILGFPVSRTQLERFKPEFQQMSHMTAEEMDTRPAQSVTMFGTLISAKTVRTHTHEKMAFLTFEDGTDMFECVAFPAVYQTYAPDIEHGSSYCLKGHIENQQGAISLHLSELKRLT